MVVLVMGGSGSGKSAWAEECIVRLARERRLYYLATMQVFDEEGREKVRRHQALRRDKGFLTVEQPLSVHEALEKVKGEAVLLECVSNLAANEMFSGESPLSAEEVSQKVAGGIEKLKDGLRDLVIVTNNVFEDGIAYEKTTAEYIRALGDINARLARLADWVVEVVAGIPLMIKGERGAGQKSGQLTGQEDICIF